MKFSAKKLIFISTLLFLTVAFTKTIFGAATNTGGTWFAQPPDQYQTIIKNAALTRQTSEEPFVLSIMTNIANGLNFALWPTDSAQTSQGPNQQGADIGAIGLMAGLTGILYSAPPASSVEYIADLGSSLGVVKPAYAQGIGFSAFSPVLSLWKTFRDIAYLGFVVIFVIVGFMVMFRRRIDPRTVVTVQESLPRIVIALLLVTFSYAIVGLMVDVMALLTSLFAQVIVGKEIGITNINQISGENIFQLFRPIGPQVFRFAQEVAQNIQLPLPFIQEAGGLGSILAGLTVTVVFGVATFFIMFKIFFMLLTAYIGIVLDVIFAPLKLMLAALPGNQTISGWLRGLLANILVFPATLVMILIAVKLMRGYVATFNYAPYDAITPNAPLTWAPPLMGAKWSSTIGFLAGFGILFSIPAVGEAVRHSLEVKPTPLEGAAGKEVRGYLGWVPFIGGTLQRAGA